jgi:serine/threonine protein phosphatase 1
MSFLKRLFGGSGSQSTPKAKSASAPFTADIAPKAPFFAIGDIHGCMVQMTALLDQINAVDATAPIIFVGDYVDRGEESAAVMRALFAMRDDPRITCLTGNHEDMMRKFLEDPAANGARWLRYGGLQTLASFGVGGVTPQSTGDALVKAAEGLAAAMGEDMITWLDNLDTSWKSGNVAVVHAGADPNLSIAMQSAKTLQWGHKDFDHVNRADDTWVIHGHTIVDTANATSGRIAIDTGAYATGTLTAAYITQADVQFLQV